jgi:hypothetical protein
VIFLGPTARYFDKVPQAVLAKPARTTIQFFYFQYKPYGVPDFPDSVDFAVKRLNGKTVIIRSPGELAKAIALVKRQMAATR